MVVALIALVVSVTGGAYAAIRVTTANIANRAVTQPKLGHNAVWHVNIGRRSVRQSNLAHNSVWHVNIGRHSVRRSNIATAAIGRDQIAFKAVGPAQLDIHQPWQNVGPAGPGGFDQARFQNGWHNAGIGPIPTAAGFTEDVDCVVHLRGQVAGGTVSPNPSSGAVFTLPINFRPIGGDRYFPALTTNASRNVVTPGWVAVNAAGQVFVGAGNNAFVALDNISFSIEPDVAGQPQPTPTAACHS
jgi:hypothetical protein